MFRAQQIKTKDIDPILSRLLHRWSESIGKYVGMRDEEVSFSRGFKRLVEHPRFKLIDDWSDRLVSVLNKDIPWFEKQEIVRILETEPQSYITIESRLFKEAEFMQFRESELDRLDIAAEKLFHMQDKATS